MHIAQLFLPVCLHNMVVVGRGKHSSCSRHGGIFFSMRVIRDAKTGSKLKPVFIYNVVICYGRCPSYMADKSVTGKLMSPVRLTEIRRYTAR